MSSILAIDLGKFNSFSAGMTAYVGLTFKRDRAQTISNLIRHPAFDGLSLKNCCSSARRGF